jgi:hypothetical protein
MVFDLSVLKHRLLFGGTTKLRSIESRCLDLYLESLDHEARKRVEKQVQTFDLLHRQQNDKLVLFRYLRKTTIEHAPPIPNQTTDICVATITLKDGRKKLHCEVIFDEGYLTALLFNKPPRQYNDDMLKVASVKILADILKPSCEQEYISEDDLATHHLKYLRQVLRLKQVELPVSSDIIKAFVERIPSPLPSDLIELLSETNGFSVGPWRFLGINARAIPWPQTTLRVFAEDDQSMRGLCVDESEDVQILYVLNQTDSDLLRCSDRFIDELISMFIQDPDDEPPI